MYNGGEKGEKSMNGPMNLLVTLNEAYGSAFERDAHVPFAQQSGDGASGVSAARRHCGRGPAANPGAAGREGAAFARSGAGPGTGGRAHQRTIPPGNVLSHFRGEISAGNAGSGALPGSGRDRQRQPGGIVRDGIGRPLFRGGFSCEGTVPEGERAAAGYGRGKPRISIPAC